MMVRILRHVHEKNEKQCKKDDACEWVMILVEAISSLTEQVAGTGTDEAQPNSAAVAPRIIINTSVAASILAGFLVMLFLIHCDSRHMEGHECVHGTMST